jgi:glycosyltransferase involved in cell wall biosynthesis
MACGKPVVAANTSSLPEIIDHGLTGILCPRDDVSAFVAACRRLAGNLDILQSYGQAARRSIEERFSEDLIIPQYINLYKTLSP